MKIQLTTCNIADVLIVEPQVFGDSRGFFYESYNQNEFQQAIGRSVNFVQDNHAKSSQGVLRGMHYQMNHVQAKLVRVVHGAVFDVVVDMRSSSRTFGQWFGLELSAENKKQLWIPEGMAHGYLTLSEEADFCYKTSDFWDPSSEQCLSWSDKKLSIAWPLTNLIPIVSDKDNRGLGWESAPKFIEPL